MHGIQKLHFTKIFLYFGWNDELLQSTPQTKSATIGASIPYANIYQDIKTVELREFRNGNIGKILDSYKKVAE